MMTRNVDQEIDQEFLRMRVKNAWEYRKKVIDTESCRVIFGEADFLPGLVVDKFSDVLVVQSLALGIDKYKIQLDIYKRALEYSLKRKVDKVYIYSLCLQKAIEL